MKLNVLFVNGIPDNKKVEVVGVDSNGNFAFKTGGVCDFYSYLKAKNWRKQLITLNNRAKFQVTLSPQTHILVNQIAEADSHQQALKKAKEVIHANPFVLTINRPELIEQTRRDRVSQQLSGLKGVHMPQTLRFAPRSPAEILEAIQTKGFAFPVIFRSCGSHAGKTTRLLKNPEQVLALYDYALDGRDCYLTQFVDFAQDGIYTKYRLVVVGGDVLLRHVHFAENWLVHRKVYDELAAKAPEYRQREYEIWQNFETELKPKVQSQIQSIYAQLPLDYFGIDCSLLPNGDLLIFELNANMLILRRFASAPDFYDAVIDKIEHAFVQMVEHKYQQSPPS